MTQENWKLKLKSFIQLWFSNDEKAQAIFSGMAKAISELQDNGNLLVSETFIDTGSDEYVAQHGDERSVLRFDGENLSSYRLRVKTIVNQSNLPEIKRIVDALLLRGKSTIIEHHEASNFLDRSSFLNRNIIDFEVLYNAFTILIDYQTPEPTSFYNFESFLNREYLQGSNVSSDSVFYNVIEAVNKNKALGTVYRLIERANK